MRTRRVRIVLQARTSSQRLPGKSLMPMGGLPLAILCARRLASTGREVLLATSDDRSDDLLAALAAEHGVRSCRGSLEDVLGRYLTCVADLEDDDLVVRATADNPVPDGAFVDRLIGALESANIDYLGCSSPEDGLPYGLSAEVFTAGALRACAAGARDARTNEHVTTQLRARAGSAGIVPRGLFLDVDRSSLRVTIDTLEDYLRMTQAFRQSACPESVSWSTLIELVAWPSDAGGRLPCKLIDGRRYSCITLGTAQLGMNYGISNTLGRPNDVEAGAMMAAALHAGVTHLDTARTYGDAEQRIGRLLQGLPGNQLQIVSKLSPLTALGEDACREEVRRAVDGSVATSCRELARARIDVMMFHRCADMFRWGGAALERLAEHVSAGTIGQIGVSVYAPQEAVRSLDDRRITQLQIPFNLLDQRWFAPQFQHAAAARPGVAVHARSVFLQGLLLSEPARWPSWAEAASRLCSDLRRLVASLQRRSLADLCIAFVRASPWVTSLVVGVESAGQLEELLRLAHEPPLSAGEVAAVRETFTDVPERLLNPSLW